MKIDLKRILHDISFPLIFVLLLMPAYFSHMEYNLDKGTSTAPRLMCEEEKILDFGSNIVLVIIISVMWAFYSASKKENSFLEGIIGSIIIGLFIGLSYAIFDYNIQCIQGIQDIGSPIIGILFLMFAFGLGTGAIGLLFGLVQKAVKLITKQRQQK